MPRLGRAYSPDELADQVEIAEEVFRCYCMPAREIRRWLARLKAELQHPDPQTNWSCLPDFFIAGYTLQEAERWCSAGCDLPVAIVCETIGRTVDEAATIMSAIDARPTGQASEEISSWLTSDLLATRIANYIRAGVGFEEALHHWETQSVSAETVDQQLAIVAGLALGG